MISAQARCFAEVSTSLKAVCVCEGEAMEGKNRFLVSFLGLLNTILSCIREWRHATPCMWKFLHVSVLRAGMDINPRILDCCCCCCCCLPIQEFFPFLFVLVPHIPCAVLTIIFRREGFSSPLPSRVNSVDPRHSRFPPLGVV